MAVKAEKLKTFLLVFDKDFSIKTKVTQHENFIHISAYYEKQEWHCYFNGKLEYKEIERICSEGMYLMYTRKRIKLYTFYRNSN